MENQCARAPTLAHTRTQNVITDRHYPLQLRSINSHNRNQLICFDRNVGFFSLFCQTHLFCSMAKCHIDQFYRFRSLALSICHRFTFVSRYSMFRSLSFAFTFCTRTQNCPIQSHRVEATASVTAIRF